MFKKMTLVVAVCVTFTMLETSQADAANRGSSWRWSKPINQRLGAFYTSNRAFKQTNTRSTNQRRYSTNNSRRWFTPSTSRPTSSRSNTFYRPGRAGVIPFNGVGRPYPF